MQDVEEEKYNMGKWQRMVKKKDCRIQAQFKWTKIKTLRNDLSSPSVLSSKEALCLKRLNNGQIMSKCCCIFENITKQNIAMITFWNLTNKPN